MDRPYTFTIHRPRLSVIMAGVGLENSPSDADGHYVLELALGPDCLEISELSIHPYRITISVRDAPVLMRGVVELGAPVGGLVGVAAAAAVKAHSQ